MTPYQKRELAFDNAAARCYREIVEIAARSDYDWTGDGKHYVDMRVGKEGDIVTKIRILVDFRGEYFSAFITGGKILPIAIESYIRNCIYFTAKEAYDGIMVKISKLMCNEQTKQP